VSNKIKIIVIALSVLLLSYAVYAATHVKIKLDPRRTVSIVGVVDGKILDQANKLTNLVNANPKGTVYIAINSPGGMVVPGFQFLTAMKMAKLRGTKLVCVVPVLAASMAFHFLAECSEVYTTEFALLLWHPMKASFMFQSLTPEEMEYEAAMIRMYEAPLNARLIEAMKVEEDFFYYHYAHETLWIARALKEEAPEFIKIVDVIEGLPNLFSVE
jgi:ATP-dependent protease ClpP protease subunit